MVDAGDLARDAVARAREQRLIETAERNDNPPPPISIYAGFDCKTGEALLRPAGGGILRGQPLYNTAVRPGDIMDLHVSQGLPKADSLSAWEPEPEPVVETEKVTFGKLIILFRTPDGGLWIGGDRSKPKRIGVWDAAREWSISKNGAKENGYVVTGLSRGTPQLTPQILRYGGGRSFTITNDTSENVPIYKVLGGAGVISPYQLTDEDFYGPGSWDGPGVINGFTSSSSYGASGQYDQTGSIGVGSTQTTTLTNNANVIHWSESIAMSRPYSINVFSTTETDSNGATTISRSSSVLGAIQTNILMNVEASSSDSSSQLQLTNEDFIDSIFYVGAKTSSTIYTRTRRFIDVASDVFTFSTKHYIDTTELSEIPTFNPFGSRVTLSKQVFYESMGADFRRSSFAYVRIYRIVESKFQQTEEITVPIISIPEESTIIDYSYHP